MSVKGCMKLQKKKFFPLKNLNLESPLNNFNWIGHDMNVISEN